MASIRNRFRIRSKSPGTPPGTLEYMGEKRVQDVSLTLYTYDQNGMNAQPDIAVSECKKWVDSTEKKVWIHVHGLHDIEKLKPLFINFNLHPLIREDIVNTDQRSKVEEYDNCIYIVMRMMRYSKEESAVSSEQVSLILGDRFVISFQESDDMIFKPVIGRLGVSGGQLQKMGIDYLAYALIDNITDHYFKLLDLLGEELERLEDELMEDPDEDTFHEIHAARKDVIFARRTITPSREMLNELIRDDNGLIDESTQIFMRDTYDHTVQIIENIENDREMIIGLHDMYMSYVSNKMNEVMKVLTIIATIFIPLTFIAGIYGMNFNPEASPWNMPELSWYWGYPAVWVVMIVVAIIMVIYFKHEDWL